MADQDSPSLYQRLGGVYSIATVMDDLVDRIMIDPRLNSNPRVDEAHHRVPPAGFKYLLTEMVCGATGGPVIQSGGTFDIFLARTMHDQEGGSDGGSVTLLRPDGTEYPGSPFTGGSLPSPWAVAVDGNDNVWISNFAGAAGRIAHLCGVRTETCPPGMKTGDQISPPGGYVGGGLQMQTDLAIDPAGNVWVMNNWEDIDSCFRRASGRALDPLRRPGRYNLLWHGQAGPRAADRAGASALRELR